MLPLFQEPQPEEKAEKKPEPKPEPEPEPESEESDLGKQNNTRGLIKDIFVNLNHIFKTCCLLDSDNLTIVQYKYLYRIDRNFQ